MEGGAIAIGDQIALSSTPGVGMKASGDGETIGIALGSATTSGMVDAFIHPAYNFSPTSLAIVNSLSSIASTTSPSTGSGQAATASNFFDALFSSLKSRITQWLADASNGISDLFAKNIYATNATADILTAKQKLCVGQTCVTEAQLQGLLASADQSPTASSGSQSAPAASGNATNTPPVITIAGENPAHIHVGDSYVDLGAIITGPLVSDIVLDTSTTTTDTIDYVATDQNGLTSTSTRTVIIEPVAPSTPQSLPITASPPLVPTNSATSTATSTS